MKSSLTLVGIGLLGLVVALFLCPGTLQASDPAPDAASYQLLTNSGMEAYDAPYGKWQGADLQVASGWQRFWYDSPEPAWMDTREFDRVLGCNCWVERIEGSTSQMVVSTEPYTAGLQQRASGLTPGVGYGFHAAMLTIYQTSAGGAVHGTMIKQIGIDPTGGTDPQAATIVWSEPDDHDEGPWDIDQRVAAFAQASKATVFIRVISLYDSGGMPHRNISFLDSAILAETPYIKATSPITTEETDFVVKWDNVTPGPGASDLKWMDVQWLDEAEGLWHDWQLKTRNVEATFEGEMGHVYRFRARAFQRYPNGAHLYSPYRPEGDTTTMVGEPEPPPPPEPEGPVLTGSVFSPEGLPVAGATVKVSGTSHIATSDAGGRYAVSLPPLEDPQSIVVSHPYWLAPAPVFDIILPPTGTVSLTWSLLPPSDVMANGEFEQGLAAWSAITTGVEGPQVVSEPVRTGHGALALANTGEQSATVGVSQIMVITNAWEPGLSFLYRTSVTGTNDLFRVVLTLVTETISTTVPPTETVTSTLKAVPDVVLTSPVSEPVTSTPPITGPITITVRVTTTQTFTPALTEEGWQHLWYAVGPAESFLSGTVSVLFEVWSDGQGASADVHVDQVSMGATPGGPFKTYLPAVTKLR